MARRPVVRDCETVYPEPADTIWALVESTSKKCGEARFRSAKLNRVYDSVSTAERPFEAALV